MIARLSLHLLLTGILAMVAASATSAQAGGKSAAEVAAKLAADGRARVMLVFGEHDDPIGSSPAPRDGRIAREADRVLARLPAGSYIELRRFTTVAALVLEIDRDALEALEADPSVQRIDLDSGGGGHMNIAAPLARVSNVRNRGLVGLGVKTAVIDSGIRLDHPDFSGRIVGQQCFCASATPGIGCCPNGLPTQSGAGSATDGHGHGTNVAGIVAGSGGSAPQGGAPAATIVAVRVLDANNSFCCASDVVAAMDWVATQHPDTRVVNMSLGTNALFATSCDATNSFTIAMAQAAAALHANGTVMTASAGNQGSPTSVSAPACLNRVIAMGATWTQDWGPRTVLGCTDSTTAANKPTCFSNSGSRIALYAPGAFVTAPGRTAVTSTFAGTSQATPLVASCIADLFQARPGLSPDQVRAALVASPSSVVDPKNGLTFPRLDCEDALLRIDRLFADGFD